MRHMWHSSMRVGIPALLSLTCNLALMAASNVEMQFDQPAVLTNATRQLHVYKVAASKNAVLGDFEVRPTLCSPVVSHFSDVLESHDHHVVANWAISQGGVMLELEIGLPTEKQLTITGELKIKNRVGKTVYERESNGNLVPPNWYDTWVGGEVRSLTFYWNGCESIEKRAPKGEYTAELKLNVNGEEHEYSKSFFIDGEDAPLEGYGACGAGWGLAFIPVFGMRLFSFRRRRNTGCIALREGRIERG